MSEYILGLDVGTTGTKTYLFRKDGALIAHAYKGYDLFAPHVGYSEQWPEDWWNAVKDTIHEVLLHGEEQIGNKVVALSISSQGGTIAPFDKNMLPLCNAIVWNDARGSIQRQEFLDEVGTEEDMYRMSGWSLQKSLGALDIRWWKDNKPEIFKQAKMFLSVPDYLSYKLTGIAAVDISNLGINQTGDISKRCYKEKLLKFMGITQAQLPKIVQSGDVIGNLTESAAEELGLSKECILVAGAHDQYAVALGSGAINSGDIIIGSGTCWVVTALANEPDFESGIAQSVSAVPGLWGTCWSLQSGGVCLDWFRKNIALGEGKHPISYDVINNHVPQRKAAEEGLFFYPFQGFANDGKTFSKGSFIGMDMSHDHFSMLRAIMEGVAFQLAWMMEHFKAQPNKSIGIKLAGGATKSPIWCQILADIIGMPVHIPEVSDQACVGAAILAGLGSGIFLNHKNGFECLSANEHVVMPDITRSVIYKDCFEKYKANAVMLGDMYHI